MNDQIQWQLMGIQNGFELPDIMLMNGKIDWQ